MYNLMYEDTSQSSFTMLRHWIESGDFLNKYLQEHNYDQLDPTGLALGCHFGSQTARGTYAFTTDTNQSLTTQIFQNAFAQLTAVTTTELELKGVNDHRAFQSIITDPVIGGGKSSLPDYQGLDATCMGNKMGPILQRISDNWLSTVVGILSGLSHYEIVRKAFTHIAAQNTTKDPYVSEPPENKRKGPFTLYFAWCKEVFVPLPKKGNSGPATKDNGKTT
ncbi:MAG: hypothetical protein U5N86_07855 [Planctomycetota bacterium]|nr:hypothetical protein [Planctomycetota bacterium]